jgi:protein-S-isoprenylcysteine O-methyltransferase Ste14
MELFGKSTINPIVFYSGKISGYITWIVLILSILGADLIESQTIFFNDFIALTLLGVGLFFSIISLFNLGKSIRFGLPVADTTLKTSGLYKLSRNPMYVGFNLITIASMVFTLNFIVLLLGVYTLVAYHLIIKSEERFLMSRFGAAYNNYMLQVRRYL